MLMPFHQFCDFNFNTCQILYNGFVLIKTCILILPFLTYIKIHIFNLSSLFIKCLHMFLLPDVVSASIAGIVFMEVALSVTPVSTELTEILNMILSYKS